MKKPLLYIALGTCALALSCSQAPGPEERAVPVADITALMYRLPSMTPSGRDSAIAANQPQLAAFMKVVGADTVCDSTLQEWTSSMAVRVFTPAVDSVFGSADAVSHAISYALAGAEAQGLSIPARRYAAVTYGRKEPVLFVDSVMLVAQNHFLGAEYEGYGPWPAYLRMLKTPQQLPYTVAEALVATAYPYEIEGGDENATLLSRMLYEGALVKAVMAMVEKPSLAQALGYNSDDMAWLEANEARLWNELVAAGVLYETSESVIGRFVAPAPATRGLESLWPGRVARFIGYRLVEKYCRSHPETTAAQLLSKDFYDSPAVIAEVVS